MNREPDLSVDIVGVATNFVRVRSPGQLDWRSDQTSDFANVPPFTLIYVNGNPAEGCTGAYNQVGLVHRGEV